MNTNHLKFRLCYTAQDGSKYIFYNSDKHLIGLDGTIYENYGKDWKSPTWETIFDGEGIIQQYVGLKDVNKKDIYVGDIIKIKMYDDWTDVMGFDVIYQVMWCPIQLGYRGFTSGMIRCNYAGVVLSYPIEIIGNIFENEELFK